MIRSLLAASLAAFFAGPAAAGDFATYEALGFSDDGSVFAFEQFGVQDGSGFPYSEIFVVDLDEDRFLPPSPVRVRLDTDGADLAAARSQAQEMAQALLAEHAAADPGVVLVANAPTEVAADPHRVAFLPRAIEPTADAPVELRISLIPFPDAPELCTGFGHSIAGFRLVRVATSAGETAELVHEDESLPASRNCPFDYRIAEVRTHPPSGRAVVVIAVKSVGFEGPDLRYLAVPMTLD